MLQKGKNKQVFCSPEYDLRHRQQQAQREVEHLELQNLEGQKRLLKKKKELAQLTKHQMAYNYMIKRNRKFEDKQQSLKKKQA